ncbi:ABC transporter permease [Faecalicatena orotica]|jgi:ABC-type dipeptide/oligopeptide/nickel transport system permease subunit|uniref:Peptide/nickel transport system permease protein/glutathione transport system permease protein n=1 Tax=Faecalicatena orotica TaxID=1544 RepID=A0A2Y9BCM0_9FIRM|nr:MULTISPECIES: ABC transporter permease [Clostridia]PWJ29897.1 peptide/nickel transport system permease protein/glutathione transport system permease protein [Faecalicatena orotica]SSA55623.1 peptide/nickel transport system permease protein/glutathione transport system permease protein [Faecalicatena orotica]
MSKTRKVHKQSQTLEFFQRMTKAFSAKLGIILLALIVLVCLAGPFFSPYEVNGVDLANMYSGPSSQHLLGCDSMGRDLFTRLMYGGRYSLALGICASLFGAAVGVIIGSIGGYFGGMTETVIMRLMDVWSALPGTMLCILVSSAMGSGFFATVLALTVGGVPGTVRMIRGQILSERSREYIEAAQSINCSNLSIMFKHLLPNVIQPIIVTMTMGIGSCIIMAASLSYIGLGIQPPNPEWGAMLSEGRAYIRTYPHLILVPGIIIALAVFAINLMGDGVRDALDPKLRD